jgi:hypothetical protein
LRQLKICLNVVNILSLNKKIVEEKVFELVLKPYCEEIFLKVVQNRVEAVAATKKEFFENMSK